LASQIAKSDAAYVVEQSARVRELSQVYAKGGYDVDARQLGRRMVDHWLVGAGIALRMEP
jgi:anti-sigma28 factor (negative regulator of flagellin synthesis)